MDHRPVRAHERVVELCAPVRADVRDLYRDLPLLHALREQATKVCHRASIEQPPNQLVEELLPFLPRHELQSGRVVLPVPGEDVLFAHLLALPAHTEVRPQHPGVLLVDAALLALVEEALDDVVHHELLERVVQLQGPGYRLVRDLGHRPGRPQRVPVPDREEERHDDRREPRVRHGLAQLRQAPAVHLHPLGVRRLRAREHRGERRAPGREVHAEQAVQLLGRELRVLLPVQPPHHLEGLEGVQGAHDPGDLP
mmetsp:Transcript_36226/g.102009  ORF Transcript_36226/g.102009 Transcript_36226/m.102009 type:complete len:254 (+) Transcript_36226:762-1523(+)